VRLPITPTPTGPLVKLSSPMSMFQVGFPSRYENFLHSVLHKRPLELHSSLWYWRFSRDSLEDSCLWDGALSSLTDISESTVTSSSERGSHESSPKRNSTSLSNALLFCSQMEIERSSEPPGTSHSYLYHVNRWLAYSSTQTMVSCSSETSVNIYQTTQRYISRHSYSYLYIYIYIYIYI
jgi:hypothetical protein